MGRKVYDKGKEGKGRRLGKEEGRGRKRKGRRKVKELAE